MRIGALFILILTGVVVQSDRHVQAQSPSLQRVMQEKVETRTAAPAGCDRGLRAD